MVINRICRKYENADRLRFNPGAIIKERKLQNVFNQESIGPNNFDGHIYGIHGAGV
jgi:hypothetical protein